MQIASVAYAPVTPVRPIAPAASQADQLAALDGLASVILDTAGRHSDGDKLDAYKTSQRLSVTGRYRDVGPDGAKLLNQIAGSTTAQKVETNRVSYAEAMSAAIQKAGPEGGSRSEALGAAALKHLDGLPGSDQQALFSSVNAPDRTGATPFADLADWRGQMSAMARLPAGPVDRVDLSDYAKTFVSETKPSPPSAPAYVAGSMASIKV